jgi:mannosyl-oligosaccharide glucosidase
LRSLLAAALTFRRAAAAVAAVAVAVGLYLRFFADPRPRALRPFRGPPLTALPQFHQGYQDRMLWGTYRPGLYFGAGTGMTNEQDALAAAQGGRAHPLPLVPLPCCRCAGLRTRTPRSLLVGLMWVDPGRGDALDNIRHEALQRDGAFRGGWRCRCRARMQRTPS